MKTIEPFSLSVSAVHSIIGVTEEQKVKRGNEKNCSCFCKQLGTHVTPTVHAIVKWKLEIEMFWLFPPTESALFNFAIQRLWNEKSLLNSHEHLYPLLLNVSMFMYSGRDLCGDPRIFEFGKKAAALCSNPVRLTVSVTFSTVERVTHLYEVWFQPQASRRGQHTRRCTFSLPPKVLPCPPQSMVWKEELKERSNSSSFIFIHFHFGLVEAISEWILAHRAILIRRIHNLWEWLECQGARFEWFTTARFDVLLS